MNNPITWRLSAMTIALLASGNNYADETFHFAQQPNNNGDHTVVTATGINQFQLSDLMASAEGKPVDATNAGALSLTVAPAQGDAQASGVLITSGTFANQSAGRITIRANALDGQATASGSQPTDAYWSTVINRGNVNVNADSLSAGAAAYGINSGVAFSDSASDHYGDHMMLRNDGSMQVNATASQGADAFGIYSNAGNGLINNGNLLVTAQSARSNAAATGLYTISANPDVKPEPWNQNNPTHLMSNNGLLTVSATGSNATASGIYTEAEGVTINNSGTLLINAVSNSAAGNAAAYGVNIVNGSATLNSSGKILTSASGGAQQRSYEVMANGSVVNITQYVLTLGDNTPWAVSNGGTIALGNNGQGADLVFMAGKFSDGFAYGKAYNLASLAYDTTQDTSALVEGSIASMRGISPDFKVNYISSSSGGSLGSAALVYAPEVSHAGISALAQRSTMEQASTIISSRLYGQMVGNNGCNQTLPEADNCLFINPYAGEYRRNQDTAGYTGQRVGIMMGQDYQLNDWQLGWHGGYESASTNFNGASAGRKEDLNTLILGLQGGKHLSKDLFIAATSSWFHSKTDYHDSNTYYGVGSQSSSYDSNGLYSDVSIGQSWQLNRNYTVTPMAGLTHIWQQRDGYTVSSNNSDYDLLDTHYRRYSDNAVAGHVGLRIDGRYPITQDTLLKPFVSLGLQQMLYGNEMVIDQQVVNSPVVGVSTKDKTTQGTFDLGMSLVSNNGLSSDLRVSGSANGERQDFTGWANITWSF